MTGVPNPPIPGHHLMVEGGRIPIFSSHAWDSELQGYNGGCECGCQPLDFPNLSRNKVKAWHRQHKAELRAQGIGLMQSDRFDRALLMRQVLDAAEEALRMGNTDRVTKVIFVWSQRREHLLAGEETWEDQHV